MKNIVFTLALASVLALSACSKPAETPATTPATETPASNTATTTQTAPADTNITSSPYMDFSVKTNRTFLISHIQSSTQLTPEQVACLQSSEGDANYLQSLDPFVKGVLTADEIKEADEFFATEAGRKFEAMALNQLGAENAPPVVEPTDSEKVEIVKAASKPFVAKMQAKNDAMSEQESIDFIMSIADKEKQRCKIS